MISPRPRANRSASVARLAAKRQHPSANLGKEFNAPPVRHARSSVERASQRLFSTGRAVAAENAAGVRPNSRRRYPEPSFRRSFELEFPLTA